MTIAALAQAGGVGVETVRYYQRRGLMRTPARSGASRHGSSVRRYTPADVRQLRFIKPAQAAGFRLDEIAELLTLDRCDDRARAYYMASERLRGLDDQIAALEAARTALARLAHACGTGAAGPCPIIEAFAPSDTPLDEIG